MSGSNPPFPPTAPTSLQNLTTATSVGAGAYLYEQYSDDDNVRAFFTAYNTIAQEYLSWFVNAALPIYTQQSNGLLDWVANGLYGIYRPVLTFGSTNLYASYGQLQFGNLIPTFGSAGYGQLVDVAQSSSVPVSDDLFQRIMTWHLYRGDGWQFGTKWLKRRIHRFINGPSGIAPASQDNTYDVSVTATGAAITITLPTSQIASLFSLCVSNGVLALPFQYTYTIVQTTVPFAQPIFLNVQTRSAYVIQEQPWHPLSALWRGNATGQYVKLPSHVIAPQEQPWHPQPVIWRGVTPSLRASPATSPAAHVVVNQEQPWHPTPRTWKGNARGTYLVKPFGAATTTLQEQPRHPAPRI